MLILTRKEREKVIINDNIVVEILGVDKKSGSIKIGIEAPKEIPIIRAEIKEEIRLSNLNANAKIENSVLQKLRSRIK
ncbi:MAG: carbon storage regulator [Epsilonproteobacteria bacterium]|nr:carbon storage regulator [Campylobacterota bacterium]